MSRKATEFQRKTMSRLYRGKEIFKPMNTGRIDEHVACVREWIANIFFYTKNGKTIMIDAGYNYPRLKEKMGWLDIDPAAIRHILVTHQDTDHVGALETDSDLLFKNEKKGNAGRRRQNSHFCRPAGKDVRLEPFQIT